MSLVALVDVKDLGRFKDDFSRYRRMFPPPDPVRGPASDRALLGVLVAREPWSFEAIAAVEDHLQARWTMALAGAWTVCACPEDTGIEAVLGALDALGVRAVFAPTPEPGSSARAAAEPTRRAAPDPFRFPLAPCRALPSHGDPA